MVPKIMVPINHRLHELLQHFGATKRTPSVQLLHFEATIFAVFLEPHPLYILLPRSVCIAYVLLFSNILLTQFLYSYSLPICYLLPIYCTTTLLAAHLKTLLTCILHRTCLSIKPSIFLVTSRLDLYVHSMNQSSSSLAIPPHVIGYNNHGIGKPCSEHLYRWLYHKLSTGT